MKWAEFLQRTHKGLCTCRLRLTRACRYLPGANKPTCAVALITHGIDNGNNNDNNNNNNDSWGGFEKVFSFHKSLWRQHSKHMQLCFIPANLIRRPRPNKLCLYFVSACLLTSVYRKVAFFFFFLVFIPTPVPNERQSPIYKASLGFEYWIPCGNTLRKTKKKECKIETGKLSNDKKFCQEKKKKKVVH